MKVVALLAVIVLLLVVYPAVSQVSDDKLIVPGQRIGKWTLGMTIDRLLQMNGPRNGGDDLPAFSRATGDDLPPNHDLWGHRWIEQGLVAITNGRESQTIVELLTNLSDHKTNKGIGRDSSIEAVHSAYGQPTAVAEPRPHWRTLVYDGIGLTVAIRAKNTVAWITVFRPGTARQLYKF